MTEEIKMKKIIILAMSFLAFDAWSKDDALMSFSFEPVKAIHGSFAGHFQYKLKNYMSLTVLGNVGTNWINASSIKTAGLLSDNEFSVDNFFAGGGLGLRFYFANQGLSDGFFAEPRLSLHYSKYQVKERNTNLIDSNRLGVLPALYLGYSWFFNNGFYLSTSVGASYGYYFKNDVTVDAKLQDRLADKKMTRSKMWAHDSKWRFDYDYDISLGFAW